MKERNVILCVLLTFLTCGIYSIVWLWNLNNEIRVYNNKPKNSGKSFLLSIVTCGIYSYIWQYKLGEEVDEMDHERGDTGIIFLLSSLFCQMSMLNLAFAQNEVNKICRRPITAQNKEAETVTNE